MDHLVGAALCSYSIWILIGAIPVWLRGGLLLRCCSCKLDPFAISLVSRDIPNHRPRHRGWRGTNARSGMSTCRADKAPTKLQFEYPWEGGSLCLDAVYMVQTRLAGYLLVLAEFDAEHGVKSSCNRSTRESGPIRVRCFRQRDPGCGN